MSNLATLPSSDAVNEWLDGQPGATQRVVTSMLGRAALLSIGLYAAGARGKQLAKYSIAGAMAIEVFVVWWIWSERQRTAAEKAK